MPVFIKLTVSDEGTARLRQAAHACNMPLERFIVEAAEMRANQMPLPNAVVERLLRHKRGYGLDMKRRRRRESA